MKRFFLLLTTLVLSQPVLALDDVANFDKWNYAIDFHGIQNQTGESIAIYSARPHYLQFRLELSSDFQSLGGNFSDIVFYGAHVSVLLYQLTKETSPIRPYIGVGYDLFFHSDQTGGTTGAYTLFPGIQFWQPVQTRDGQVIRDVGFFIEGGPRMSNFVSQNTPYGQKLSDGFLMRLGILGDF